MTGRKKSPAGYRATGALLLVLALVVTAGCIGGVDAEEVREDALDAMDSAETYDFEMEMDVTMGDDMPGELSISMDGEGSVDEAEERMEMFVTTGMLGIFEMDQDVYVVDDAMYMRMDMGGMEGMDDVDGAEEDLEEWLKIEGEPMVSEMWDSYSYAEQYQEMLEISEVSYEDDAEVDGEDAYVITLEPDPEEYDELAQKQMGSMDMFDGMMEEDMEEMEELFGEVTTEEISASYWISQETDYILRSQSEATVTMPMGMNGEEVTTTMEADIRMFNHGEDVDIQLPEGAEDAVPFDEFTTDEAYGSHSVDERGDHGSDSGYERDDGVAVPDDHEVDEDQGVDVPEDVEVDEEVDNLVESVEVEVHEFEDAPDTYWATVRFEEFEGEWLRVESVEGGGHSVVDSPRMTDHLGVNVASDGDEIVVTLAREDGTVVEQRETYETT